MSSDGVAMKSDAAQEDPRVGPKPGPAAAAAAAAVFTSIVQHFLIGKHASSRLQTPARRLHAALSCAQMQCCDVSVVVDIELHTGDLHSTTTLSRRPAHADWLQFKHTLSKTGNDCSLTRKMSDSV
jgi:hypothetical protein